MFRELALGSATIEAGVMGNLLVHPDFRSSLTAVRLVRAARGAVENDGSSCKLLLVLPLDEARELLSTLGHRSIGRFRTHTHPLSTVPVMRSRFGPAGFLLGVAADEYSAAVRGIRQMVGGPSATEVHPSDLDPSLRQDWSRPPERIVQSPSVQYLKWRSSRPDVESRVFAVESGGRIVGLVSLDEEPGGTAEVSYCAVDHAMLSEPEAMTAVLSGSSPGYTSVSAAALPGSGLSTNLLASGFLPRRGGTGEADELLGYWSPDHPLADRFGTGSSWSVLPGINDI